jgi:hypothetical protein
MGEGDKKDKSAGPQPEISFSQFIFMQYQQGKLVLGDFPNPETGKYEVNLPLARYTIDVLAVLEKKTQGNLTEDEAQLLENALHELRIGYLEKLQKEKEGKGSPEASDAEKTEEKAQHQEPAEEPKEEPKAE